MIYVYVVWQHKKTTLEGHKCLTTVQKVLLKSIKTPVTDLTATNYLGEKYVDLELSYIMFTSF